MQLGVLNLLLGLPANGNAGTSPPSTDGDAGSDIFSQLLGDASTNLGQGGANSGGVLANDLSPAALVAQEVGAGNLAGQAQTQATLTQLLNQDITPQEAAALVAKLDTSAPQMSQGGTTSQNGLWQQLRSALQQVAEGDQPQKLANVLEEIPAVQDHAQAMAQISDATQDQSVSQSLSESPVVQRMLAWMQAALEKNKEAPTQTDAAAEEGSPSAAPNDVVASLQAATFRPHDDVDATADKTASAQDTKKKEPTVVDIVPLSQPVVIPAWIQQLANGQSVATPALDAAIPPLAIKADDTLPSVSLPTQDSANAEDASTQVAANNSAPAPAPDWLDHLPFPLAMAEAGKPDIAEAAPSAQTQAQADDASQAAAPIDAVQTKDSGQANAPNPLSALANPVAKDAPKSFERTSRSEDAADIAKVADASDANSTQTNQLAVNAAQGTQENRINTAAQMAAHLPNVHATPTEQIHVAIRQATGDGIDHITIQLEPADLGRVEVSMSTGNDGRTHMSFTADKPSTLSMLSRDAVNLERSLADTGIKADAGSMQFNLRQQPQPQMGSGLGQGNGQGPASRQSQEQSQNDSVVPITGAPAAVTKHYTVNISSGVDIHA